MAEICIESLCKAYSGSNQPAALYDLNLSIGDGKFVTLLGPSGCGKTTTLRLIAGYLTPDSGKISVAGRVLSDAKGIVPPEERGMGMVFQNYAIWPHMSVFENVSYGLKLRRQSRKEIDRRVSQILSLVNLTGLEGRMPNQLSGGQQQRVALARSLVVEPNILLLDEPLSNLDAKLREKMRAELKQLQRRTGLTFVYVTHDQAEALAMSDHIGVMDGGRLQQFGPPEEIYGKPANRMVAAFMGQINVVSGTVMGEGGKRAVRIADGLLLDLPAEVTRKPGEAIDVGFRPEAVRLAPAHSAGSGSVVDLTYFGNLVEYQIALANRQVIRVETHPRVRLSPGTHVDINVSPDDISVFHA